MHQSFFIKTTDGLNLFAQVWEPKGEISAVTLLVHGIGEHSGRYEFLANKFNQESIAIFAFDLRGSGRSEGPRGHTPSYQMFMSDIDCLLKIVEERYPRKPKCLYGHSLGGNLVLNYSLKYNPPLCGAIVTSPWLKLVFDPPLFKIILGEVMDKIWPSFSQENGISAHHLSHDSEVVRKYMADPLVHNKISTRLFFEATRAGHWALECSEKLTLPLLLMHGTNDQITSPEASKAFFENQGSNCTLKLWEGQFHELHNEVIKEDVINFTLNWLKKYI
ncbi:MAG: lysophospholipase [Peptococcales bacterium]|jgi:alpha-beta hydrolase superfamily lysophospholipase